MVLKVLCGINMPSRSNAAAATTANVAADDIMSVICNLKHATSLPCRHTKHRQDKVLQELTSSATPPAPVDIEELNKVGRHAEVSKQLVRQQYWGSGSANK